MRAMGRICRRDAERSHPAIVNLAYYVSSCVLICSLLDVLRKDIQMAWTELSAVVDRIHDKPLSSWHRFQTPLRLECRKANVELISCTR